MFIVSLPGIHISLGICLWGYTYHGDTHITVTPGYFFMFNRDKSSFANLVPRYFSLVNLNMRKGPLHVYIEMEQAINNTTFLLSYFFH